MRQAGNDRETRELSFFLLNGQERPSKKVTTDRDMKCMSELISCLGKSIPNKKKRAKTNSHSETSQWISWYSRVASAAEQREGGRGEGGRGQLEMRSEGWLINHQPL